MLPEPTERLRFRPMTRADLPDITALLTAPGSVRPDGSAYTQEDAERWIRWTHDNYAEYDFGLWVIETLDGEFVGDCGLTVQDVDGGPEVEIGYRVLPGFRGAGLATEAAGAVCDLARAEGIDYLVALIRPGNVASQRVASAVGLTFERRIVAHDGPALLYGVHLQPEVR